MAVIKTVTKGQPIKASWANSLVHEVNTKEGLRLKGTRTYSNFNLPSQAVNDTAWQIRRSVGCISLNAGQIYINGILIDSGIRSFNQVSSANNWVDVCNFYPADETEFPVWFLTIKYPDKITTENLNSVECNLILNKYSEALEAPTRPEQLEEGYKWQCIQLNTVDQSNVVQLVSGTIYLNDTIPSIVAGDGIKIEEPQEDVLVISCNPSVIANVDVDIRAGENVRVDKSTDNTTRVFTVHANLPTIPTVSIVAGDGIQVDASQHGDVTAYTISNTYSPIIYDFDEQWFIVTDNKVTLNEEKLDTLVNEAINELGVEVTGEGLVESTFRGNLVANTQGTLTLNTEVSY